MTSIPDAPEAPKGRSAQTTVLVIDDEESVHESVRQPLKRFRTLSAFNAPQALRALEQHHVDVIVLDLNLPGASGFDLLEQLSAERGDVEVVVLTAHSELKNAVRSIRLGAFDFLVKSFETYQSLGEHIDRALRHRRRRREAAATDAHARWLPKAFALLEGSRTDTVQSLVTLAHRAADTPISVLIEGETGVGKEVLARYIHAHSSRSAGPFIAVHVAAVPPTLLHSYLFGHVKGAFTGADRARAGRFELASGGTLFLDEVAELSPEAQVGLLRALQEREVERLGAAESTPIDVRIVAATNKSLSDEVSAGRFRQDLLYRLNVLRLSLPPLRERPKDLAALCRLLADKHAERVQRDPPVFSADAIAILSAYEWPGNVRELENLVMRLCALYPGTQVLGDDVPPEYWLPTLNQTARQAAESEPDGRLYQMACQQFQRYLVRLMIARCDGNKRAAARALGISYSTLKEKARGL